jgi:hypothetical protein
VKIAVPGTKLDRIILIAIFKKKMYFCAYIDQTAFMNFCCVQVGFGMWSILTTDKISAFTSQGAGSYNFLS